MRKPVLLGTLSLVTAILLYFLFWPVPIEPVAWQPPPNPGHTGVFAPNERLRAMERLPLGGQSGPEDVAVDQAGRLYAATHDGWIVRLAADGSSPQPWVNTGGRPLGIVFDAQGNLLVADAYRGLLRISPDGQPVVLASEADGIPIRYANNIDVAADGRIYFSDASTKFGAEASGGTYPASLLDILEHGAHGRLLVYEPATDRARSLVNGLHFANGVAVSADQSYVLVVETGLYRVLRYWLSGPQAGQLQPFIENLPGFPDNLTRGLDGRYWLALLSPRSELLDQLAGQPWLRKVVQRLPAVVRPKAVSYNHVIALNGNGQVVLDLQDPGGGYPLLTAAAETRDYLYFGSLVAPAVGRLSWNKLGL